MEIQQRPPPKSLAHLRHALLDAMPEAMVITGPDGEIIDANRRAVSLLGQEVLHGGNLRSLLRRGERRGAPRAGDLEDVSFAGRFDAQDTLTLGICRGTRFLVLEVSSNPAPEVGDGMTIHSLRDVSDRQRAEVELRRRAAQQRVIAELGLHAIATPDLDELCSYLCERVSTALDVDLVGVLELLPGGSELLLRHGHGWAGDSVGRTLLGARNLSLGGFTLAMHGPVVVEDLRVETRFRVPEILRQHGIVSSMTTIIYGGQAPYGVLCAHARSKRNFGEDDVNVLQEVANLLAQTIERHRAEETLRLINRDLTDRVEVGGEEREVLLRELETLNHEFKDLSYTSAHDLRSPLRAIDGYASALHQEYGEHLDGTGRSYVERIRIGARRIGNLLDAVVELAQLSNVSIRHEQVNLSELAERALESLCCHEPSRPVRADIRPGLTAYGDARLLGEVLEQLLDNALKFSRGRKNVRIEVGSTTVADEPVYYVRDNGVGFDMRYGSRLFVPFQRLHSEGQYEGIGIGLAKVKRIVNRHGGRVWAEGKPGIGTVVYFSLGRPLRLPGLERSQLFARFEGLRRSSAPVIGCAAMARNGPSGTDSRVETADQPVAQSRPVLGFLLMIGAAALLPIMDGIAKHLSASYPLSQVVWARYTFHLLTMLPLLLWRYGLPGLWPRRPGVQLLRGALLLTATVLFFAAIARMPLASALALFFVSPLVVTALAPLLLGESVGWRRWLAVMTGFLGVWIVMRPGMGAFQLTGLLAVAAGTVHGLYLLTTRKLSGSAPPLITLAYTAVVGAAGTSVVALFVWMPPTPEGMALMVLMGLLAAVGHLLVIWAFDLAPASVLAPAGYFEIIMATIVGLVAFGEFPDAWTWVGVAVIAGSGLFISLREHRATIRPGVELTG